MEGSTSDGVAKISGKMHLLDQNVCTQNINTFPQVLNDVYRNFISMANVIEKAAVRDKITTMHISPNLVTRIWELKYLMGFIRSALKWCVNDRGVLNRSLVDLLTRIEVDFIDATQLLLSAPSSDESVLVETHGAVGFDLNFLEQEILDTYLFIWKHCLPSTCMFTEESVMERLNQAMEDDWTHKKQAVVMKRFVHFIKEAGDQASLQNILPWVDYLLDMMMCYFFHRNIKGPSSDITSRLDAAINCIVLHIFVWHSESCPPFSADLLVAYVECIQENLSWVLKEEYYYLAEQPKQQIIIIHDVLSYALSALSDMPKYEYEEEKKYPNAALKQLGWIILSFFAFEFDGNKTSSHLTEWLFKTSRALCLQLDADSSLTNEALIQYAYCFQRYWSLLPTYEAIDMESLLENQSKFDEDLLDISRVVFYQWSEYHVERDMLLKSRAGVVDVLRSMGSIMCSSFVNEVEGRTRAALNFAVPELLLKIRCVKEVIGRIVVKILKDLRSHTPQTDLLGFLSFILENLEELRVSNLRWEWDEQLQTIQDGLVVFRAFLQKDSGKSTAFNSLRHLSIHIRKAAYDAEYIIYGFVSGAILGWCRSFLISDLIEQFKLIKEEVKTGEIFIKGSSEILPHEPIPTTNQKKDNILASSRVPHPPIGVVVGFEVVMKLLMERVANDKKQLDVISVTGMPGIGKTTLAKKVFEDPYTVDHFQIRVWCVVSHDYDKKDLLLRILGTDGIPEKSFEELGVVLHKKLMGRRYLIVLDDIWDIDAFICLRRFFPNVNDGSRIVLTSRAILTGYERNLIKLNLLSDDESWNILKEKVYPREEFPGELLEVGKRIAKRCGGLPLAVVLVAGLLVKSHKDQDVWKDIAERLKIYSATDDSQGQGMNAVDLSYELLPDHLKPLFLYVGAFPEDESIRTENLKWLWIAEGFIRKSENRSQEDQAETYLMDLINRSILMADQRSSNGLVKTCRIHDLIRDMALSKAKGEEFFKFIGNFQHLPEYVLSERRVCGYYDPSNAYAPTVVADEAHSRRGVITYDDLSTMSMPSCLNSVLFFSPSYGYDDKLGVSIFEEHKMLRVFHASNLVLEFKSTDVNVTFPTHLRYISFYMHGDNRIPASVFKLWDLETLIIRVYYLHDYALPSELWKMTKLRNLQ